MANSIAKLAQEARSYFVFTGEYNLTKRANIWIRKVDAPEYVERLVFYAHRFGDLPPDDYIYAYVVDALDRLSEANEDATTDDLYELAGDIKPDLYAADLLAWLSSHTDRLARSNKALQDFDPDSTLAAVQYGQLDERKEVFNLVLQALEHELEDREEV